METLRREIAVALMLGNLACGRSALPGIPPRAAPLRTEMLTPATSSREPLASAPERVELRAVEGGLWVATVPAEAAFVSVRLAAAREDRGDLLDAYLVELLGSLLDEAAPPGVRFAAATTPELLIVGFEANPESALAALDLLAAAVSGGELAPEPFARHHRRRLRDVLERETSSLALMKVVLRRQVYGNDHPWGRDADSTMDELQELELEAASERLRELFPRLSSAFVMVGPPEHLVSDQEISARLGALTSSVAALPPVPHLPTTKDDLSIHFFRKPYDRLTSMALLHLAPASNAEADSGAFLLFAEMMKGASSGFETRLVRRNGVTELLASRTTASGEAAAQLLLHLDWLRRVRNGGASAEELRAAVRRLEARTLRSRGRPDLVSEELAARLVRARRGCGTPAECPDAVALGTPPGLDALKAEDIAEVARRCIDPDRADVAWVGPPSSLHPLGARGRVYEYEVE